jgi:hypothetical protein
MTERGCLCKGSGDGSRRLRENERVSSDFDDEERLLATYGFAGLVSVVRDPLL